MHRDLAISPVPHLTAASISTRITDPAQHTPEQAKAVQIQDELIDEFLGADAYLFSVPMYNLSMPSVFKAWLDQIMVDGRTLDFANGAPSSGRPAVVISARGGGYSPGAPTTAGTTSCPRWKPSWVVSHARTRRDLGDP